MGGIPGAKPLNIDNLALYKPYIWSIINRSQLTTNWSHSRQTPPLHRVLDYTVEISNMPFRFEQDPTWESLCLEARRKEQTADRIVSLLYIDQNGIPTTMVLFLVPLYIWRYCKKPRPPKCSPILLFQNISIFMNVLDVSSGHGDRMELNLNYELWAT